ncbi:hypothetical protein BKA65DRAFT_550897 [Rhexocercosporidium sp. MPI-PUGE-AT-0058]|nr:hypothetical protein BKA65DRAFT_550897 [Rhexocercosporidium sp. MPI-PUGE-AT-0058]
MSRRPSKAPSVPELPPATAGYSCATQKMVSLDNPLDNSHDGPQPCSWAPRGIILPLPHDAEHPKVDSIQNSPLTNQGGAETMHTQATPKAPIVPPAQPPAFPPILPPGPGPGIPSNDTELPFTAFVPTVLKPHISTISSSDWARIKRLRSEIWGQRSRIQEMRASLREKQNRKAAADDDYIQFVRLRGHGVSFGIRASSDDQTEIDFLFNACVAAREDYGPFEDACNTLETKLSINEFELDRLESKFYDQPFQPQIHPLARHGNIESSTTSSSDASTDSESENGQQFHPLVTQYLSKLGDVDILRERLDELLEERYILEEEREKRARVEMKLSDENEEWLANYSDVESGLIEQYEKATQDMEILRKRCIDKGWVDETGEPLSLEHLERQSFVGELDGDGEPEASEYVKFPKLIPQPGSKMANTLPEPLSDECETTFSSFVRVNGWILEQLRTSPLEVGLLARTFESRYGIINEREKWQSDVLQLWYRDGTPYECLEGGASSVVSTNAPHDIGYSSSRSSLETQIPPWDPIGEASRPQMFSSDEDSVYSGQSPPTQRAPRPIRLV